MTDSKRTVVVSVRWGRAGVIYQLERALRLSYAGPLGRRTIDRLLRDLGVDR